MSVKTWHLTVREEDRLRMFEGRVLKRILKPMRKEVMGKLEKLHNEELHNLWCSQNIIRIKLRMTRWVEHVASTGEVRNLYKTLVREPEGKRMLGRPRCSREHNTK
jgi:hypothetical protein